MIRYTWYAMAVFQNTLDKKLMPVCFWSLSEIQTNVK
jgi:hypothetical protein